VGVLSAVDVLNVPREKAYRLLHPKLVVVISSSDEYGRGNVMTAAWAMPVSSAPPMVVVAISPKRLTYEYVKSSKEFVINVPSIDLIDQVRYFGSVSGKEENKLSRAKVGNGRRVKAPILLDSIAWLECKVTNEVEAGDHVLFIAEVIEAYVKKDALEEDITYNLERFKPILHLGGDSYTTTIGGKVTF